MFKILLTYFKYVMKSLSYVLETEKSNGYRVRVHTINVLFLACILHISLHRFQS